jgi:threonine synthase
MGLTQTYLSYLECPVCDNHFDPAAVAVTDHAIMQAQIQMAELEGIFAAPESAAALAGLKVLLHDGKVVPSERVVVFNTATGLKYT